MSVCMFCADVCSLAADAGPCQKSLVRWYYSTSDRRCHEFVYGGCEGNDNRFVTEQQCISQCGSGGSLYVSNGDSNRLHKDPGNRSVFYRIRQC